MAKTDRIQDLMTGLRPGDPVQEGVSGEPGVGQHSGYYLGYFTYFNRQLYYEAHDVLEHLWLRSKTSPEADFFKGLIQLAGAYVHLQKQFLRPTHPKDGRRMHPAVRLFALAQANLERFTPIYMDLDVATLCAGCQSTAEGIRASNFTQNPWSPDTAPSLNLLPSPNSHNAH